jgi:hypothetical protein
MSCVNALHLPLWLLLPLPLPLPLLLLLLLPVLHTPAGDEPAAHVQPAAAEQQYAARPCEGCSAPPGTLFDSEAQPAPAVSAGTQVLTAAVVGVAAAAAAAAALTVVIVCAFLPDHRRQQQRGC